MHTTSLKVCLFAFALIAVGSVAQSQSAHAWSSSRPEAPAPGLGNGDGGGDNNGQPQLTVCFADNSAGVTFRARGYNDDALVQSEAMRECKVGSIAPDTCRPLGCRAQ